MKHLLICSRRPSVSDRVLRVLEKGSYDAVEVTYEALKTMPETALGQYDLLILHLFHADDIDLIARLPMDRVTTLLLDSEPSLAVAIYALERGAKAYSNAMASEPNLKLAVEVALAGDIYLPEAYMAQMLGLINNSMGTDAKAPSAQPDLLEKISSFLNTIFGSKSPDGARSALTPRERAVAEYIVQGYSNKQIARELGITPRTVKAHQQSMFNKFEVHDRLSLALYLQKH